MTSRLMDCLSCTSNSKDFKKHVLQVNFSQVFTSYYFPTNAIIIGFLGRLQYAAYLSQYEQALTHSCEGSFIYGFFTIQG